MMGDRKRVFVAVDFSDNIVEEVDRVQRILNNVNFTGKLTELENLHLTMKFLGDVDEENLMYIRKKLREIKFDEFEIKLGDVGIFSYKRKPRIIWIKIMGKGIFDLQKKIDEVLGKAGFKEEERFMSHMTIARIKYVKDVKKFKEYISSIKLRDIRFNIGDFKLIESDLSAIGPVYTDLEIYNGNKV